MCFDPISMLVMGGSALASGIAGGAEKKTSVNNQIKQIQYQREHDRQAQQEAIARRGVLGDYLGRQDEYIGENQNTLAGGLANYVPETQENTRAGAEATRASAVDSALASGAQANVPLRESSSPIVAATLSKKLREAAEAARASGMRTAKLSAYGDLLGENQRSNEQTGRGIKTTNAIATGNMALLPYEQDLVGFQKRTPIATPIADQVPGWVGPVKGFANLGSAMAGSGKLPGDMFGNMFKPTPIASSTSVSMTPQMLGGPVGNGGFF